MTTTTKGLPPRLCPFSVYDFPCEKPTCEGCQIRITATAQANAEIADNMKSFWSNLNAGSEK